MQNSSSLLSLIKKNIQNIKNDKEHDKHERLTKNDEPLTKDNLE